MSNGVMEGMNSVIQVVKNRARGYRGWRNLKIMCYLEDQATVESPDDVCRILIIVISRADGKTGL